MWKLANYLKVDDDGKIVDAKFKTFGCGSAIASSSLATEWVKGKSLDEAATIKNSDIAKVGPLVNLTQRPIYKNSKIQ